MRDRATLTDHVVAAMTRGRRPASTLSIRGHGVARLFRHGRLIQECFFHNLITEVGDQYYAERATGISSPPAQVTGMRLGTGTTTPSKTGAGAAIVTYIVASDQAIDSTFPQSSLVTARRITWRTTWAAGVATATGIAEVVITNENPLSDVAGTAANTISRALLSPVADKTADDSLEVTWHHDALGA